MNHYGVAVTIAVITAGAMSVICLAQFGDPVAADRAERACKDSAKEILASVKPNQFDAALLIAARDYRSWFRISDRANWAPFLCVTPPTAGALRSNSDDENTHGRKLYHLFSTDPREYMQSTWKFYERERGIPFSQPKEQPSNAAKADLFKPGHILVKESWIPEEVPLESVPEIKEHQSVIGKTYPPEYFVKGDKAWKMKEMKDLFIMLRLAKDTEGTDEGWVYGVVSPDGKTVLSSGRIESCMECHKDASVERLFGPVWLQEFVNRRAERSKPQPAPKDQPKPATPDQK